MLLGSFIQAAGRGFKETAITADPAMSNKMKGEILLWLTRN